MRTLGSVSAHIGRGHPDRAPSRDPNSASTRRTSGESASGRTLSSGRPSPRPLMGRSADEARAVDRKRQCAAPRQGHAIRLGLDTTHLNHLSHRGRRRRSAAAEIAAPADLKLLRVRLPPIAAAWFAMRGCAVSFPDRAHRVRPVVSMPEVSGESRSRRRRSSTKDGWAVGVGHHPILMLEKGGHRVAYDPDVIDLFFIIDGDLTMYLIPSQSDRRAGRRWSADVQEVHRRERGWVAWRRMRRGTDGGRVAVGVSGLRWRRSGVGEDGCRLGRLSAGVRGSAGRG